MNSLGSTRRDFQNPMDNRRPKETNKMTVRERQARKEKVSLLYNQEK